MKSPEDILRYIADKYKSVLGRPHMHASSPQALEDVLVTLDALRQFLVCENESVPNPYGEFLAAHGFGAANYTARRYPPEVLGEYDMRVFADLSEFWKSYLKSQMQDSITK